MDNNVWKIGGSIICTLLVIITTLSLFITTGINDKVIAIDSKLFKHLTNHELHIPRGQVVTRGEFEMYSMNTDRTINGFKEALEDYKKDNRR